MEVLCSKQKRLQTFRKNNKIKQFNDSIAKWRLSSPDIQELLLLAAGSQMRLLSWLTNRGNPAMKPHADGKKGTRHKYSMYIYIYTVEKREG